MHEVTSVIYRSFTLKMDKPTTPKMKTYSKPLTTIDTFPHYDKNPKVYVKKSGKIQKLKNSTNNSLKQEILVKNESLELFPSPPTDLSFIDLHLNIKEENKVDDLPITVKKEEEIDIDDDYDEIIKSENLFKDSFIIKMDDIKEEQAEACEQLSDSSEQQIKTEPMKIDDECVGTSVERSRFSERQKKIAESKNEIKQKSNDKKDDKTEGNGIKHFNLRKYSGSPKKETKKFRDTGIQVDPLLSIKFSMLISTDRELNELTSIPTFKILETLEHLVNIVQYKTTSIRWNIKDIIIMTFMKLKHNMSYETLAVFFKCRDGQISKKNICQMIDILNTCLRPSIYWPSRENMLNNIPKGFGSFEKIRVAVDCIEINAQKSLIINSQLEKYSYYKNNYKIKIMIGVTPTGLISFASKPYDGHISESFIFKNSAIIEKMDKGDILMTDSKFSVSELCQKNGISVVTPACLKSEEEFMKEAKPEMVEESLRNQVMNAHIYMTGIRERLNNFEVLGSMMPICLLNKIDRVFNIMCGIINLSRPVIKD